MSEVVAFERLLFENRADAPRLSPTAIKIHSLKTWPEYFEGHLDWSKTAEVRSDDRDYKEGDVVVLREWDPIQRSYSGRHVNRVIGRVDKLEPIGVRGMLLLSFVKTEGRRLKGRLGNEFHFKG